MTDATKEISDLIQGVQGGVEESVKAAEQAGNEVEAGAELAEKSGQALEEIQKAVAGVTGQIEQISAASEEVSASADEMVKLIEMVMGPGGAFLTLLPPILDAETMAATIRRYLL